MEFILILGQIGGHYTIAPLATKIYAFEPHPDNINPYLKDKIQNHLHMVTLVEGVLNNFNGKAKLYTSTNPGGHTISEIVGKMHSSYGHNGQYIEVDSWTLDSFCDKNDITGITAIKIDVEGAEQYVLQGAKNTLVNNKILISLETHQHVNYVEVYDFMVGLGYKWWNRDLVPMESIKQDDQYLLSNYGRFDN